jgi:hypothetical protein
MMARTRLTAISEEAVPELIGTTEHIPVTEPQRDSAFTSLLLMSLRALSQRAIVALASLVDFALLASAFALWLMVIAQPTTLQLIAVAGYAVFVLCAIMFRRR